MEFVNAASLARAQVTEITRNASLGGTYGFCVAPMMECVAALRVYFVFSQLSGLLTVRVGQRVVLDRGYAQKVGLLALLSDERQ
jgi:hypothetical protein